MRVKKLCWHTTCGDIEVEEPLYREGKRCQRPFVESAQVANRHGSQPLQRVVTDFGAEVSFAQAVTRLHEHYGVIPTAL